MTSEESSPQAGDSSPGLEANTFKALLSWEIKTMQIYVRDPLRHLGLTPHWRLLAYFEWKLGM